MVLDILKILISFRENCFENVALYLCKIGLFVHKNIFLSVTSNTKKNEEKIMKTSTSLGGF